MQSKNNYIKSLSLIIFILIVAISCGNNSTNPIDNGKYHKNYELLIAKWVGFEYKDVYEYNGNNYISYYQENARIIAKTLDELGISYTGGKNSPYIWMQTPNNMKSWDFFDYLLNEIAVVGTPGAGFGKNGEGWFRLTAFGDRDNTIEAMDRLKKLLKK